MIPLVAEAVDRFKSEPGQTLTQEVAGHMNANQSENMAVSHLTRSSISEIVPRL